jgi:hypothetical protein
MYVVQISAESRQVFHTFTQSQTHEISGSHGGEYEDDSFLGYSAV